MEQLRDNHGTATSLHALRFLAIRLKSRPETAALEPAINAARAKLAQANDAWEQAIEERVAASAEITYLDSQLDDEMLALGRDMNALVRGDKRDARYQKLFPIAPSKAMQGTASEAQDRFVQHVISRITEDTDLAPMAPHGKALKERLEALKAALARREGLYLPEAKAAADRRIALDEARRAYNATYAQLLIALGNDRALAESFFASLRRQPAEEPEPTPAPQPAPPAP